MKLFIAIFFLSIHGLSYSSDSLPKDNSGFLISASLGYVKGSAGEISENDFPTLSYGVGYQFNNHFKLKLGKENLGDYTGKERGCAGWYCWNFDYDIKAKTNYAIAQYLFESRVPHQFYVELGRHSWELISRYPSGSSRKLTGTDSIVGFGIESRFEKVSINYSIQKWLIDSGKVNEYKVGVSYTF